VETCSVLHFNRFAASTSAVTRAQTPTSFILSHYKPQTALYTMESASSFISSTITLFLTHLIWHRTYHVITFFLSQFNYPLVFQSKLKKLQFFCKLFPPQTAGFFRTGFINYSTQTRIPAYWFYVFLFPRYVQSTGLGERASWIPQLTNSIMSTQYSQHNAHHCQKGMT